MKTPNKQPKTAAELREAGLFKMSAEIPESLYRELKSTCASRGLILKRQIEIAIRNHLKHLNETSED